MKRLILKVGLPRSGKTTSARAQGFPIVNPDSIRLAMHGRRFYGPAEPMVWAHAFLMVEALFLAGHGTVIVDATNVSQKRRRQWEPVAERCEAVIELDLIRTTPEVCLERARAEGDDEIRPVIRRMWEEWDLEPRPPWSEREAVRP